MTKKRKVPLRICIGCRTKKPKKDLVRIVRTPEGEVVIDPIGKKAGRGAYLCPQTGCLQKAVKGKRLEKNLEMPISEALVEELKEILENEPPVEG